MRQRLINLLVALDQLAWVVLTLGNGMPDETISAAAYRLERDGRLQGKLLRPVIDFVFLPLEREHCRLAYEAELYRRQLPTRYANNPEGTTR